jgi:hypothetical protein
MLFNKPIKKEGVLHVKNEEFYCKIFIRPDLLSAAEQNQVIELFGSNRNPGEAEYCLGITYDYVKTVLQYGQFEGFILVENATHRDKYIDRGVAVFEYINFCENDSTNTPKILISNVCRNTRNAFFEQETLVLQKPKISPMFAIFDIIRNLAIEKKIYSMYLKVDKKNNGYRVNKDSHEMLTTKVYPKYGFVIDPACIVSEVSIMRSDFKSSIHLRKTVSRRNGLGNRSRKQLIK